MVDMSAQEAVEVELEGEDLDCSMLGDRLDSMLWGNPEDMVEVAELGEQVEAEEEASPWVEGEEVVVEDSIQYLDTGQDMGLLERE